MRKADTIESQKLCRLILDYSAKIKDNLMLANVYRMVANGKGIGLNSVKSRVESMKGRIDIPL